MAKDTEKKTEDANVAVTEEVLEPKELTKEAESSSTDDKEKKTETEEPKIDGEKSTVESEKANEANKDDKKEEEDNDNKIKDSTSETSNTKADDLEPPPQPPRPLSPFQQALLTLTEAFPTIEANVVRAVLIASGGQVDPAFNGLLSLSDPDYKLDETSIMRQANQYPAPPPVPKSVLRNTSANPARYRNQNQQQQLKSTANAIRSDRSQIEEDERLARLLAEEERLGGPRRVRYADTGLGTQHSGPDDYRRGSYSRRMSDDDEEKFNFDEEFAQVRENLTKGFNETKDNINNWFGNLRKKIDSDEPSFFGGLLGNKNQNRRFSQDEDELYDDYSRRRERSEFNRGYQSGPARARSREQEFQQDDGFQGISITNNDLDGDYTTKPPMPPRPGTNADVQTNADKKIPLKSTGTTEEEDPFFIGDSDDEDEDDIPLSEQLKTKQSNKSSRENENDSKDKKDDSDKK